MIAWTTSRMGESGWRMRASTFLAGLGIALSLACSEAPAICGNETEIWFHRVVRERKCDDCVEFKFSTPIFNEDTFRVRAQPDHILESCGISEILEHVDAVTLVLSSAAYEPLFLFREAVTNSSKREPLLIRLQNGSVPAAVIDVESIHHVITLFDLDTADKIDRFIQDLRPDTSAVSRTGQRVSPAEPGESPAQAKANRLLRELRKEFPHLEELPATLQ